MDELLLSLRRLPMIILAALLVIPTGCLALGEQMVNVSPEATASLASPTSAPVTGARAPDFTLTDLNGSEVSLSGLRGQPVLLNFWATW